MILLLWKQRRSYILLAVYGKPKIRKRVFCNVHMARYFALFGQFDHANV